MSLPDRALLVARLLSEEDDVPAAAAALNARRESFDVPARVAAFTSLEPARDVVRLATNYDVELVLLDAPAALDADRLPGDLAAIAERSPADVAALSGPAPDWTAATASSSRSAAARATGRRSQLGAWLAAGTRAPLRLVGTNADPSRGQRDASRLLADASLATQRVVGVAAEPLLADATEEAFLAAVAPRASSSPVSRRAGAPRVSARSGGRSFAPAARPCCSCTAARARAGSRRARA